MVTVDTRVLKQTSWRQYALRFAMGGIVTVVAGLIAQFYGPVWGGLFLAFPAIFPATVTLVAKHERHRKARHGLHGTRRGLDAAAANALGATLGSIGLFVFALVACCLLSFGGGAWALLPATLAWFFVAVTAWLIWKRRQRRPRR
jgi:hypothetical protein